MIADVLNPILKTMTYDPEGYKDYGTPEYWSNMLRDGTYYVIEAVPDTAKKTNFIVSAYMLKNGAKKQPPRPSLAKARAIRPNTQQGWLLVTLYHRRLRMSIPVTNKHRPRRLKQSNPISPKAPARWAVEPNRKSTPQRKLRC